MQKKLLLEGGYDGDYYGKKCSFDFLEGDFVQSILGDGYDSEEMKQKSIIGYDSRICTSDNAAKYVGQYDAVVINACFGNFFDQGT